MRIDHILNLFYLIQFNLSSIEESVFIKYSLSDKKKEI